MIRMAFVQRSSGLLWEGCERNPKQRYWLPPLLPTSSIRRKVARKTQPEASLLSLLICLTDSIAPCIPPATVKWCNGGQIIKHVRKRQHGFALDTFFQLPKAKHHKELSSVSFRKRFNNCSESMNFVKKTSNLHGMCNAQVDGWSLARVSDAI